MLKFLAPTDSVPYTTYRFRYRPSDRPDLDCLGFLSRLPRLFEATAYIFERLTDLGTGRLTDPFLERLTELDSVRSTDPTSTA